MAEAIERIVDRKAHYSELSEAIYSFALENTFEKKAEFIVNVIYKSIVEWQAYLLDGIINNVLHC